MEKQIRLSEFWESEHFQQKKNRLYAILLQYAEEKQLTFEKNNVIIVQLALYVILSICCLQKIQEVEEYESTAFSKTNLRKVQNNKKKR